MSKIIVTTRHFNYGKDTARMSALDAELKNKNYQRRDVLGIIRRPKIGEHIVEARELDYVTEDGMIIYDFVVMGDGTSGYWLDLPYPCQPAPADPSYVPPVPVNPHTGASRRAVLHWLEHGGSKRQACILHGAQTANFNLTLRKMQDKGEI